MEEALLRKEALQQIAGGSEEVKQNSLNGEEVEHAQRVDAPLKGQEQTETKAKESLDKIEYEYANEMDEIGSSKAYAEFMQVFERFDQQAAAKLE